MGFDEREKNEKGKEKGLAMDQWEGRKGRREVLVLVRPVRQVVWGKKISLVVERERERKWMVYHTGIEGGIRIVEV